MRKGARYWLGEVAENIGLPALGVALLGLTFLVAQRLPWWAPFALLLGVVVVGGLWLRPRRRR